MKKTRKWFLTAMCLIFTLILPMQVQAETGEGSGVDLSGNPYGSNDDLRFVVCYIYMEDNEDNPYNNPNRDIRLLFEGAKTEGYLDIHNYNFADDELYERYRIVRETTYLPYDADGYFVSPVLSDANSMTASYKIWVNGKDGMSEPLLLEDYNEVYLVTGSPDFLKESGEHKLDEMYMLFHSENGSISDNPATEQVIADETFAYWQQQMIQDPSIRAWQDEDGSIYTREDMCVLGYEVPLDGDNSTAFDTGSEMQGAEEDFEETDTFMEDEDGIETEDDEDIPEIPVEKEPVSSGIPPLAVIIVVAVLALAAVWIAHMRKEKNESDLYID